MLLWTSMKVVLFTTFKLDESASKLGVDAVISKVHFNSLMDTVFALLNLYVPV